MDNTYIADPSRIERTSLGLIRNVLDCYGLQEGVRQIAERVVHAGADFSLATLVEIGGATNVKQLRSILLKTTNREVFCDVSMVAAGISKTLLRTCGMSVFSLIHDEHVAEEAKKTGITRAMVAVDKALEKGVRVFAFGNAPTGLFRLLQHRDRGATVDFVLGMPVGFVGAAESKARLLESGIPCVVLRGPRGGSNLCAAAMNAILREEDE